MNIKNTNKKKPKDKSNGKEVFKCVIKYVFFGLIVYGIFHIKDLKKYFEKVVALLEEEMILGSIVFIVVSAALSMLFLPKGVIYLGSGYAFSQTIKNIYLNLLMGTTVAFLGMFLGSICSYLLACYI